MWQNIYNSRKEISTLLIYTTYKLTKNRKGLSDELSPDSLIYTDACTRTEDCRRALDQLSGMLCTDTWAERQISPSDLLLIHEHSLHNFLTTTVPYLYSTSYFSFHPSSIYFWRLGEQCTALSVS